MEIEHATTMKAACYHNYGGPEKLAIREIAVPEAGTGEVLIRVHSSTVNRTDCGFLRGKPFIVRFFSGLLKPKSTVLGCEFSGEIVKLGEGVDSFTRGDRVVVFKDDDYGFGGHAEYATMSTDGMIGHVPEHFSYSEAAPALEGAHYALHYMRAARVASGHSVLVNGATGAIGSAAVQLIKQTGATVVGVCATQHIEQVEALGADRVIDYTREDFTECGDKFDLVFDAVGKSHFFKCRKILASHGVYASTELGPCWQNPLLAIWSKVFGKRKVLFPVPVNLKSDAEYLCNLMAEQKYRPLIDCAWPLESIAEASTYVETGMKTGNVVININ